MKNKIFIMSTIIVSIFFLLYFFLLEDLIFKKTPHTVVIQRTGQKNQSSQGAEVWIFSISTDEKQIKLSDLLIPEKTALNDGKLVLLSDGVSVQIKAEFSVMEIELLKHPWSGKAIIFLDGKEYETIDLYSLTSTTIKIKLTLGTTSTMSN
jgi:hypothetical protein